MTAASRITNVERILLVVPFVERVRREMERANIHRWSECELIRLTTDDGTVGYGETIQNYTWSRVPDTDRVLGRSPFDCMWDDSLGAGLQMALFDAAGKLAGVPVHRLLGSKVRDWCPVSFWDHDMGPEAYAREAKVAVELGFTSIKIKTRPWHDVYETVRRISNATPDWFHIDCDWNDFLLDVSTAVPVLRELEADFPKISIWEGPIKSDDVAGNRLLREKVRTPIAHHYGGVPGAVAIQQGYCDGFVVAGGVTNVMRSGISAATANMPFFIQMVGTGLTTTMALHLGAVLSHAQWPAINCHELYEHNLLSERIPVVGGFAQTPEAPGLGITLDEEALSAYRVDEADFSLPRRLIRYSRLNGVRIYFPDSSWSQDSSMWNYWRTANQQVYERGVRTEYLDDDGSPEFADLYLRASQAPLLTRET
ncbi:MAG: mandelate racemase/muconate lactonizing enzyme family protein [Caldilineaceae bacterium]|nr:mandelate racemase/muconate lactonizing enzyme family protein [Caldilineaceae bacterium]